MAAIPTVLHAGMSPRNGVLTLSGYGINVRVERGHLLLEDGIGRVRRQARLARVRHGLRRLVVIGADGMVSLAAFRWLADQNASFVMLDRDGSVLATTGPVRGSDVRLRRAQSLAGQSGAGLEIARALIADKLAGQERVAREMLGDTEAAREIANARRENDRARNVDAVRLIEAKGANAYWSAWRSVSILFPTKDLRRVPEHWKGFDSRNSGIRGTQRLASNPINAILNYLYAILEGEARIAAATIGLDPGIGVLHTDTRGRDSLACDLMEPVRPRVDAYVLDWITREPLKREWFFELPNGNCRLMAPFAAKLAETASTWAREVTPVTEWVARALFPQSAKAGGDLALASRGVSMPQTSDGPRPPRVCSNCGAAINRTARQCVQCAARTTVEKFPEVARVGRSVAHSPMAQARRAKTQRRQASVLRGWLSAKHPAWLTTEAYTERILPRLADIRRTVIVSTLNVSSPYAASIRAGRRIPHPRHWLALAELAGVEQDGSDRKQAAATKQP